MVIHDRATGSMSCLEEARQTTEILVHSSQQFTKPSDKVKYVYSDNGSEMIARAKGMTCRLPTSTSEIPQTNGFIERIVRSSIQGGCVNMLQLGDTKDGGKKPPVHGVSLETSQQSMETRHTTKGTDNGNVLDYVSHLHAKVSSCPNRALQMENTRSRAAVGMGSSLGGICFERGYGQATTTLQMSLGTEVLENTSTHDRLMYGFTV